jgi:hypothetical protein
LERVLAPQDFFQAGLEILGRRVIADEPVDLRPVAAQDERRRGGPDRESLEGFGADRLAIIGQKDDEILVEEGMKLGVLVKLLTQQSAASSATAVKIDDDQLVLGPGFGHGLVQRSLEPVLGRSGGGEDKQRANSQCFLQ